MNARIRKKHGLPSRIGRRRKRTQQRAKRALQEIFAALAKRPVLLPIAAPTFVSLRPGPSLVWGSGVIVT